MARQSQESVKNDSIIFVDFLFALNMLVISSWYLIVLWRLWRLRNAHFLLTVSTAPFSYCGRRRQVLPVLPVLTLAVCMDILVRYIYILLGMGFWLINLSWIYPQLSTEQQPPGPGKNVRELWQGVHSNFLAFAVAKDYNERADLVLKVDNKKISYHQAITSQYPVVTIAKCKYTITGTGSRLRRLKYAADSFFPKTRITWRNVKGGVGHEQCSCNIQNTCCFKYIA